MITDWVGGVQNGQNIDYVILEWPLRQYPHISYFLVCTKWDKERLDIGRARNFYFTWSQKQKMLPKQLILTKWKGKVVLYRESKDLIL